MIYHFKCFHSLFQGTEGGPYSADFTLHLARTSWNAVFILQVISFLNTYLCNYCFYGAMHKVFTREEDRQALKRNQLHPISYILHPTSYILHPKIYLHANQKCKSLVKAIGGGQGQKIISS